MKFRIFWVPIAPRICQRRYSWAWIKCESTTRRRNSWARKWRAWKTKSRATTIIYTPTLKKLRSLGYRRPKELFWTSAILNQIKIWQIFQSLNTKSRHQLISQASSWPVILEQQMAKVMPAETQWGCCLLHVHRDDQKTWSPQWKRKSIRTQLEALRA